MAFLGGRFELRLANGGALPSLLLVSLPPSPPFGGRGVGEFPVVVVVISSFLTCAWQFFFKYFGQNDFCTVAFFGKSNFHIYIYIYIVECAGRFVRKLFSLRVDFYGFHRIFFFGGVLACFLVCV